MIGFIKGTLAEMLSDSVIVECSGVGFRIFVSGNIYSSGISEGEEIKLYTHMSVKEDSITLFGFLTRDDLNVYKQLLGVNGVGPKAAMAILSVMSADDLRIAVLTEDVKKISSAPGLGKKTAQKVILELKDKFDFTDIDSIAASAASESISIEADGVKDTIAALAALGYTQGEAARAVKKAAASTGSDDSEVLLKEALKFIF